MLVLPPACGCRLPVNLGSTFVGFCFAGVSAIAGAREKQGGLREAQPEVGSAADRPGGGWGVPRIDYQMNGKVNPPQMWLNGFFGHHGSDLYRTLLFRHRRNMKPRTITPESDRGGARFLLGTAWCLRFR